jgi:hypothetical protein
MGKFCEHLRSSLFLFGSVYLIFVVFCVVVFVLFVIVLYPGSILPVSLDCPLLIVPSVFYSAYSNVTSSPSNLTLDEISVFHGHLCKHVILLGVSHMCTTILYIVICTYHEFKQNSSYNRKY